MRSVKPCGPCFAQWVLKTDVSLPRALEPLLPLQDAPDGAAMEAMPVEPLLPLQNAPDSASEEDEDDPWKGEPNFT